MGVYSFRDAKYRLVEQIRTIKAQCDRVNPPLYQGVNDSYAKYLGIKVEEKKLDFDYGGYIPANPPSRPKPIFGLIRMGLIPSIKILHIFMKLLII